MSASATPAYVPRVADARHGAHDGSIEGIVESARCTSCMLSRIGYPMREHCDYLTIIKPDEESEATWTARRPAFA